MKNIIRWFILNTVAANLLMVFIIIAGIFTLSRLRMEVFPDITIPIINVSVIYPGASPEDIEESICVKVEEQVQGINGLKRITSSSNEGYGSINIEIENGYDIDEVKDEVKAHLDIDLLPINEINISDYSGILLAVAHKQFLDLDLQLAKELYAASLDVASDKNIKALILSANGKLFCGGGNLKFLLSKR